jgi:hypothetical protein
LVAGTSLLVSFHNYTTTPTVPLTALRFTPQGYVRVDVAGAP